MTSSSIQPGPYQVNGQYVLVAVTPEGRTVLSRYNEATGGMRVLDDDERTAWLKALGVDEATP